MAQIAGEIVAPARAFPALPRLPRFRVILWLGALTALVGVVAASYLAYTGSVASSTYSIQRLQAEREGWRTRNDQLRIELARVRSLTWVEHEAVSRLKMQKPSALLYLNMDPAGPTAQSPDGPSARPN